MGLVPSGGLGGTGGRLEAPCGPASPPGLTSFQPVEAGVRGKWTDCAIIAGGATLRPTDGRSTACPRHFSPLMVVSRVAGGGFAAHLPPQRSLPGSGLSVMTPALLDSAF